MRRDLRHRIYKGWLIGLAKRRGEQQPRCLNEFDTITVQRLQSALHTLLWSAPGAGDVAAYCYEDHGVKYLAS